MNEAPAQITAHGEGWHGIPYMRADLAQAQIADLAARLDAAQVMILERDAVIAEQAGRLAERDAKRPGRYNLIALRKAADDACAAAWEDCAECRGDATNWGDFKCIGAEWFVDDDGVPGHRVWVDEADPAAYRLRDFVAGYLERAGFAGVHVVLEW
jgi:hypothetical protein